MLAVSNSDGVGKPSAATPRNAMRLLVWDNFVASQNCSARAVGSPAGSIFCLNPVGKEGPREKSTYTAPIKGAGPHHGPAVQTLEIGHKT